MQLAHARELESAYILIMGQREALDGTVIVRNTTTQAQETVPVETLPPYLRQNGIR